MEFHGDLQHKYPFGRSLSCWVLLVALIGVVNLSLGWDHAVIQRAAVNVSIDDTFGDPVTGAQITYTPATAWQLGQNCQNCTAHVDGSKTFDGTWHDATFNPPGGDSNSFPGTIITASVSFSGTGIYVYCILTRSSTSPDGNSDMIFFLDGEEADSFEQSPDGDTTFVYNSLVFSRSGLSNGNHDFILESGHNGAKALVLLDRIDYTTDDSESSSTSTSTISRLPSPSSVSPILSTPTSSATLTISSTSTTITQSTQSSAPSTIQSAPSTFPLSQSRSSTLSTLHDSSQSLPPVFSLVLSSALPTSNSSQQVPSATLRRPNLAIGLVVGIVAAIVIILLLLGWKIAIRKRRRALEEGRAEQAIMPFLSRALQWHSRGHRSRSPPTGPEMNQAMRPLGTIQEERISSGAPIQPTMQSISQSSRTSDGLDSSRSFFRPGNNRTVHKGRIRRALSDTCDPCGAYGNQHPSISDVAGSSSSSNDLSPSRFYVNRREKLANSTNESHSAELPAENHHSLSLLSRSTLNEDNEDTPPPYQPSQ